MAKFRVVETNGDGKTDLKGPHIIKALARLDKTLRHRQLPQEYQLLRTAGVVPARVGLHQSLLQLYSDYSCGKDFLYTVSGRALVDKYGANPYHILRMGKTRFERASSAISSRHVEVQLPLLDGGDQRVLIGQAEIGLEQSQISEERIRQQVIG